MSTRKLIDMDLSITENDEMAKNEITEEHLEEARKLKAIYFAKKDTLNLTQEKLAFALGGSQQSTAGNYINGKTILNLKAGSIFAHELQVKIGDFSPRLEAELEIIIGPLARRILDATRTLQKPDQEKVLSHAEFLSAGSKPK